MREGRPDRYVLTVNAEQARVIKKACELLARCHIGQFEHAVDVTEVYPRRDDYEPLIRLLQQVVFPELPSPNASYGIRSPERPDEARIAWDLYTLVRHRLAHDRLKPGQKPDHMMVIYDEPTKLSEQPRATIKAVT